MDVNNTWLQSLAMAFVRKNSLTAYAADKPSVNQLNPVGFLTPLAPGIGHSKGFLTFSDTNAALRGAVAVTWDTVNLEWLFRNIIPEIYVYNPHTKHELVAALIKRYGLPLTVDMFCDGAIDATVLPKTIQLETKGTHSTPDYNSEAAGSRSVIDVVVKRGDVNVADVFSSTVLATPGLPFKVLSGRTHAEFVYSVDFTPGLPETYKKLRAIPVGAVDSARYNSADFTALLELITQRYLYGAVAWNTGGVTDFNFINSSVVYNGPTKAFVHPEGKSYSPGADARYDHVVVIKFDETSASRVGYGFFHYYEVS